MTGAAPEGAAFWDRKADGYAESPVKDVASYERTLEATRRHLQPTDRVLEFGCGTGTTALHLAPSVREYVATDFSQRMVEIARGKARDQGVENVRFEQATLDDPALEPGSFDAVLGFNILHLLDDVAAASRRVHELLRPGGHFVSKSVCLAEKSRLFIPVVGVMRFVGLAPPVRCLTIAGLESAIAGAGFEILETGTFPKKLESRFVVARAR